MIDRSIYKISKQDCCGCKMCGDICSRQAITFPISNGFWYPHVDESKCINCGLCSKKCPVLNIQTKRDSEEITCYGVKSQDEDIRWNSTSGGFFSVLANYWISNGGVVAGAIYDKENTIVHVVGTTKEDVLKLRQSKYAQSDTSGIYQEVKTLLRSENKVLFCGTPCHVEALLSFLGKPYENLLTMDFFCLGICSPWIYGKYLKMLENRYKSKAARVWFKNKEMGWRSIGVRIDFENGQSYLRSGGLDPFMRLFVNDALIMRPNCQFCKFRTTHHISDFTVGDFWGIEYVEPNIDDNKGISALFVNTDNAHKIFSQINTHLYYFKTTVDDIVRGNFSITRSKSPHSRAEDFMEYVNKKGFHDAVYKYSSYTRKLILKYHIRKCIKRVKSFINV